MSSFFTGQKMADTSKDGLLLGGGIRHITATQAEIKEVPASVRKYCFTCVNFRQYFVSLREKNLIAAMLS